MLVLLKKSLLNVFLGVISSALYARLVAPEASIDVASLSVGLLAIPLFALLAAIGGGVAGLYALVAVIELIATKLGFIDFIDGPF